VWGLTNVDARSDETPARMLAGVSSVVGKQLSSADLGVGVREPVGVAEHPAPG
jgi:hypothetical protein